MNRVFKEREEKRFTKQMKKLEQWLKEDKQEEQSNQSIQEQLLIDDQLLREGG